VQEILSVKVEDGMINIASVIKDFDKAPLKGPHSIVHSAKNNMMFFTDSGPLGETSIENPQGSVYGIDLEHSILKSVVHNKLASPSGIAICNDEKVLYIAETGLNRVMRVAIHDNGTYFTSVFHQFHGRHGPMALAVHKNGLLYVSRFDFTDFS
jgi:sugar lactone lactonase YvrE